MPQLVDELDFEELALNMESLNAKLQNKKFNDAPFQGFVHMKLKHQPPAKYRKKKSHSFALRWHGMVHVNEDQQLLERTLDLPSAACPPIKTGDKLDCQIRGIFIHKSKQDAVPSTSPTEYHGTMIIELFAMPDRRQTRNGQILLHVFAAATSRKGLLSFW